MSDTTRIVTPPPRRGPRWIDLILAAVAGSLLTLLLIGVILGGGLTRLAGTSASPTPSPSVPASPSPTIQIRTAVPTTPTPSPSPTATATPTVAPTTAAPTAAPTTVAPTATPPRTNTPAPTRTP
jgi:hypothetical protein